MGALDRYRTVKMVIFAKPEYKDSDYRVVAA